MKNILLLTLTLTISSFSFSQDSVYTIVDKMPEFIYGGDSGLYVFIGQNITYPTEAATNNIHGKVYVSFIVNSKGEVNNAKILKDIGGGCGEEAIRVVLATNQLWKPGIQNTNPVDVKLNLPITFTCNNCEDEAKYKLLFENSETTKLYNQAVTELQNNRAITAIKYLEECHARSPKDKDVLYNLGVAFFMNNELDKACPTWKKAMDLKDKSSKKLFLEKCN